MRTVSLRYPFQSVGRSQQDHQDDLSFRHRHASHRRNEQAANGSDNAVFAITASIKEYEAYIKLALSAAAREKLCRLFRRHLSHQCEAAAGYRHRDHGPSVRVLLREHRQARNMAASTTAGCSTCSPTTSGPADISSSTPTRSRSIRRTHSRRCWKSEKQVERVGTFKTLLVCRKT